MCFDIVIRRLAINYCTLNGVSRATVAQASAQLGVSTSIIWYWPKNKFRAIESCVTPQIAMNEFDNCFISLTEDDIKWALRSEEEF